MGNKVKISTKNDTAAPFAKVTVLDIDYTKLWTGIIPVTGTDIEIDIGAIGEDGQPVWIYSHEDQTTDAKVMGGFSYIIGEESPPQEEWVAELDGATQYWTLTQPIQVPIGGLIQFNLCRPLGSLGMNEYVISGESDTNTSCFYSGETSLFLGGSNYLTNLMVDGVDNNLLPADGEFHSVSVESTNSATEIKNLGCRFSFERLLLGSFTDLIVKDAQGVVINHTPLTNKEQGATQLATVGSVNAFMANYTEAVWRRL